MFLNIFFIIVRLSLLYSLCKIIQIFFFFSGENLTSEAEQDPVSESLAIPQGPKKMDCQEDIEFLSALDKMVSENIQERMKEPVKAGNVDISVPVVLKSNIKKTYEQLQVSYFVLNNFNFLFLSIKSLLRIF